jgi:hypothetical protein
MFSQVFSVPAIEMEKYMAITNDVLHIFPIRPFDVTETEKHYNICF